MQITQIRVTGLKSIGDSGPLDLGSITLLVGRNNSGKSTMLRALSLLQEGSELLIQSPPIRYGRASALVQMTLINEGLAFWGGDSTGLSAEYSVALAPNAVPQVGVSIASTRSSYGAQSAPSLEPNNVIFPYFSSRKVARFDETISAINSLQVRNDSSNLSAKVDRLSDANNVDNSRFVKLVEDVIGLKISSIASVNGKQVGVWVSASEWIPIEEMGDGVSQLLGLIVQLSVADGKIFLIEELENDIHPRALKALLRAIEDVAGSNQFIISTHNNIVLRHLGALEDTVIYRTSSELVEEGGYQLQSTTFDRVGNSVDERIDLLADLGYDLSDLDLHDGWLILEESSAEKLIREYLIPWFAPDLRSIKTVAARGTSDLIPTFEALEKLVLFTHLESRYQGRVQVLADGEPSGVEAVERLAARFDSWPPESFGTFSKPHIELYYPAHFSVQVSDALKQPNKRLKRELKRKLLEDLIEWIGQDEDRARRQLEVSAADVIRSLRAFSVRAARS